MLEDHKSTVIHNVWLDSRNGRGRLDSNGNIQNHDTDRVRFDLNKTIGNAVAVAISRVKIDTRFPRLKPEERTLTVIAGSSLAQSLGSYTGTFTTYKIVFPERGPVETYSDDNRQETAGIAGSINDFIAALDFNASSPINMSRAPGNHGLLMYRSTHLSQRHYVALVDSKLARLMGFTKYTEKNFTSVDGADGTYNTTTLTDNNSFTSGVVDGQIGDRPHQYQIPDLYLHLNFDLKSEQNRHQSNIAYRALFTEGTTSIVSVGVYTDDERVVTPVEINSKHVPINEIVCSWHYYDGTLADLAGMEWSLKLELLRHVSAF